MSPHYQLLIAHTDTEPEKMWDPPRFGRFFDAFLAERPDFVAAVVGDRTAAAALGAAHPRKFDLTGLPLSVSLALTQSASLFVGVDSCMLHAADLADVPIVALFGPSEPREFGIRFSARRHALVRALPLSGLEVESVLAASRDVLT
jgi:ADP-heptose:LPS heptosyltransferase